MKPVHPLQRLMLIVLILVIFSSTAMARGLDHRDDPLYGDEVIDHMFWAVRTDYVTAAITSGGNESIEDYLNGSQCRGFTTEAPSFSIEWLTFDERPALHTLRIFFVSRGDATLVVRTPDDRWYCNDNSFDINNPTIDLNWPEGGNYDIWVGSRRQSDQHNGTLYMTSGQYTPERYPLTLRPYNEHHFDGRGGGSDDARDHYPSGAIVGVRHRIASDGLHLFVDLNIDDARGEDILLAVWPRYTANGNLIPHTGNESHFRDASGYAYDWIILNPDYRNTYYDGVELFIPTNQLPNANYEYYVDLQVQLESTGGLINRFTSVSLVRITAR